MPFNPSKSSRKPAVSLVGGSHCVLPSSRASGRTIRRGKKPLPPPPPPAGNNRQSNILSGHARPFQVMQASLGRCLVTTHYSWEKGAIEEGPRKPCSSELQQRAPVCTSLALTLKGGSGRADDLTGCRPYLIPQLNSGLKARKADPIHCGFIRPIPRW